MTVLQIFGALVVSLPKIFDLCLVPASLVTLLLAFRQRTRSAAALSFSAIAALSVSFLFVITASVVYVGWRFSHVAFDLLLNLGPAATFEFLASLLRVVGVRLIDFVPMIATAIGSSTAAVVLNWGRNQTDHFNSGLESLAERQTSLPARVAFDAPSKNARD